MVIIVAVVLVMQLAGQAPLDTLTVVLVAGGAAAQISSWLSGQPSSSQNGSGRSQ
ncbi:hypothetical protein [Streptosporangium longisporum]|uniref:hypothetical protein n=1 Tax=Streptosporangium longisporum TaxID=46187 RepID=UPI0031ED5F22